MKYTYRDTIRPSYKYIVSSYNDREVFLVKTYVGVVFRRSTVSAHAQSVIYELSENLMTKFPPQKNSPGPEYAHTQWVMVRCARASISKYCGLPKVNHFFTPQE